MVVIQKKRVFNFILEFNSNSLLNFLFVKNIVEQIGKDDLRAIEDFISAKKFLFGETPCVEDSIIFSYTCQFVYTDHGPLNKYIISITFIFQMFLSI